MITLKEALKLSKEEIAQLKSELKAKIEANSDLNAYIDVLNVGEGIPIAIKDIILTSDAATALQKMEFVVLQNLFMTPTSQYAHVILPTVAYGEETVTFTSLERRIQLAQKAVEPPGGLTSAWRQVVEVADRLGTRWRYDSSADVMKEIARAVPFYEGASYENLAREYGRQWPCTHDRPLGTPYLFDDGQRVQPSLSFAPLAQLPARPGEEELGQFVVVNRIDIRWIRNPDVHRPFHRLCHLFCG